MFVHFVGAKAFSKKAFFLEKALAKIRSFLTQPPFPILAFYSLFIREALVFSSGTYRCGSIHNCYKAQTYM